MRVRIGYIWDVVGAVQRKEKGAPNIAEIGYISC